MDEEPPQQEQPEGQSEAPTGGQGQSQGAGTMNMNMNDRKGLATIKTIPGILKIVCLVLGLVAILILAIACLNAKWLNSETEEKLVCPYDNDGNFVPDDGTVCKKKSLTQPENCENRNNRYKASKQAEKPCPSKLLVIPPLIVIGITWFITCLFFVGMCVGLHKNPTFLRADLIGHAVAGAILIIAGFVVLGFFISVEKQDLCSEKNGADLYNRRNQEDRELDFWRRFGPDAPKGRAESESHSEKRDSTTPAPSTPAPPLITARRALTEATKEFTKNECPKIEAEWYYKWNILIGSILAIVTGVLYLLIVVLSKKTAVRPGMM